MSINRPSSSPESVPDTVSGHLEVVEDTLDASEKVVDGVQKLVEEVGKQVDAAEEGAQNAARTRVADTYLKSGRIDLDSMGDDLRNLGGPAAKMMDRIDNAGSFDEATDAYDFFTKILKAILEGAFGIDMTLDGGVSLNGGRVERGPMFAFEGFSIPEEYGKPQITSMPQAWRNVESVGVHGGHRGVDIGIKEGAPIVMTKRVKILKVKNTGGKYVKLQYPDGTIAKFGHMKQVDVREGQELSPGDSIGLVGSTGTSTGPHIHYETYYADGRLTDPFRTFKSNNPDGIQVPDNYEYPFEGMGHQEALAHSQAHKHDH